MDHRTAKDIVLNAWKTFSTRDAGQIASLFTADAEWIAPARNATAVALAHTNHMIGPDQIARFIASEPPVLRDRYLVSRHPCRRKR